MVRMIAGRIGYQIIKTHARPVKRPTKGPTNERKSILRGPRRGCKIRCGLWVRPCNCDIIQCQPFDTVGNHSRHIRLAICNLLRAVSVIVSLSWDQQFFDPIPLHKGKPLITLRDAATYITKLPKAEHETPEWQAAMEALLLVAEHNGPTMFAQIGIMRALNRNVERVFDSSRKETHWGKRRLARDR
jgi:hypothetical protein